MCFWGVPWWIRSWISCGPCLCQGTFPSLEVPWVIYKPIFRSCDTCTDTSSLRPVKTGILLVFTRKLFERAEIRPLVLWRSHPGVLFAVPWPVSFFRVARRIGILRAVIVVLSRQSVVIRKPHPVRRVGWHFFPVYPPVDPSIHIIFETCCPCVVILVFPWPLLAVFVPGVGIKGPYMRAGGCVY